MQSVHRAPSDQLSQIIARHYLFKVALPDDYVLEDSLLSETAFIRILLKGDWAAQMPEGDWRNVGPMVFFGPNSRPLKVRCQGSFEVIGIAIRPAGWHLLFDEPAHRFTDDMIALADVWGADSDRLHQAVLAANGNIDGIVAATESLLLERVSQRGGAGPDQAMLAFEQIARFDSIRKIGDICDELQIAPHTLERHCRASFGMTPKRVLRRSRFLDMASVKRGLFEPGEEILAALRYTDQSHLNREFKEFIGMTPGQFDQTPTPLLTAGLELRNGRRDTDPPSQYWADN